MTVNRTVAVGPTLAEIAEQWPASVNVSTAGLAFGWSKSAAYEALRAGTFPAQVIKVGSRHRVLTASIVRVLSGDQRSGDAA